MNSGSGSNSVAIVGMSCLFPGAPSLEQFWQNISNGVNAIREASPQEWNGNFYKNKPATPFGQIYCTRGGFVTELADFDPLEFGIMPSSLHGGDPDQYLALRVAAEALADAGYHHKTFDGDRAEIVLGRTMAANVGSLNLVQHGHNVDQVLDVVKKVAPHLQASELDAIAERLRGTLRPCTSDTIPAVMPNVLAGRIANKLGFRGRNLILDAACASSLIAVETAMQGLLSGQSDLALAGGVHVNSCASFYQMFCGLGALSQSGVIRPFDDNADGTILGDGVGIIVLKRLEDAQRDGNKIYAVIKGIGSSSDGRTGGLLAPNVDGEALAMRRAYDMAGVSPRTVELLEAHGTGTRAGDRAEMKAVEQVYLATDQNNELPVDRSWCAIGSIKSMIGHTQAASGIAGLIKVALALHHKTLPPTLNVNTPNSQVNWSESPCYVNSQTKPWTDARSAKGNHPRRAAVSAFGFGGVNAHAVLEEFTGAEVAERPKAEAGKNRSGAVRLTLSYPTIDAQALDGMNFAVRRGLPQRTLDERGRAGGTALTRIAHSGQPESREVQAETAPAEQLVLASFAHTMANVHQNLLGVQEQVMLSYLAGEPDEDEK